MSSTVIAVIMILALVIYTWLRMSVEEKIGIDSEEKALIAQTVIARSNGQDRVIPLYAYHDISVQSKYYKKKNCLYYAIGVSEEIIYITQFKVKKEQIVFENTGIVRKSDLKWIEGNESYVCMLRFVFNFYDGRKFVFSLEESNVKVDNKCKVNIQQKEEMQEAYEIISRWMTEVNKLKEPLHPVQTKISKVFFRIAKVAFLIGVIGLVTYLITVMLARMGMFYPDIEKISTIALSLGFFIGIFCGLFGLIFDEGSKGYL